MANLDTRSKRASSVGFWKPYVMALPLPDGTISQGDRQHSAWDYTGILGVGVTGVVQLTLRARSWAFTLASRTIELTVRNR